jgi:exopolyphosphatase/guanosine-5'-triphosphate,3'-diphosphate pyrophosphatase
VTTVAAIDLGSNAVRLLISRDGVELERRSTVTRLGQGVAKTGELGAEARDRTVAVLRDYADLIDQRGARRLRAVATVAVRSMSDRSVLLDDVRGVLGVEPVVLSAAEEARLAYRGAAADLPVDGQAVLVVDIGGGSTELVLGRLDGRDEAEDPAALVSMDVGSGRLTETQLPSDPPRPEELSNAIAIVQDHLEEALRTLPSIDAVGPPTIVGVGGTVTTVAAVELGLSRADSTKGDSDAVDVVDAALHHFHLSRDAAEDVFRTLAREPLADRVHNPGLPRARADIIVGGCCIVVSVLRRLKAPAMLVSLHDLLDGVVAELFAAEQADRRNGGR